jgi:hypothetical protein
MSATTGKVEAVDGEESTLMDVSNTRTAAALVRHLRKRLPVVLTTLAALGVFAGAAPAVQAAPALDFNPSTIASENILPGKSGTVTVSLKNVGDAAVASGGATVTVKFPDELVATGATGGNPWSGCSVDALANEVTCTGPATNYTIPAGATQCSQYGVIPAQCPISVTFETPAGVSLGAVATEIEACVTGAPPCATTSVATSVRNVGDGFGFAQTVDPDNSTSAPAYPGEKAFWAGVCDLEDGFAAVGDLPAEDTSAHCIAHPSGVFAPFAPGVVRSTSGDTSGEDGWIYETPADSLSWRLDDVTAAAAHPDGTTGFWFAQHPIKPFGANGTQERVTDGALKDVIVKLPPGVVGNPNAVPKCPSADAMVVPARCHPSTQVGVTTLTLANRAYAFPVYNMEPRDGKTAEFLISGPGYSDTYSSNVSIVARARTNGDFGVDALALEVPAAISLTGQSFTFWGVPWAASHDRYRPIAGYCGNSTADTWGMPLAGLAGGFDGRGGQVCSQEPQSYDIDWGPIRPFLTTQTECSPVHPVTSMFVSNWHTSVTDTAFSQVPLLTDCADVPFAPAASFEPTSQAPDSASGLGVDIEIPQNNDPPAAVAENADDATGAPAYWKSAEGRATAQLDKTVVTLPEGMSVNPSAATGLQACSDAGVGVTAIGTPYTFDNDEPSCPNGSYIGTASATTPLLDGQLSGELILGEPKSTNPQSGEMFRLFLVLRNRDRGLIAKIHGTSVADPATGQLTATFDDNPRVPVEDIHVDLKGGDRGILATPQACGQKATVSQFTPWTAAHGGGGPVRNLSDPFTVVGDCSNAFAPSLAAGMDTQAARSNGTFSFRFARAQGQQYLRGLTAVLPKGLLASVKDVPLCSNAQAAAGSCPAGSKIGIVDAKAGSGDPFVLERKGEVFLTDGYKGGEYGLAVKIRPVAGPFRGAMELSPIIVRQAIHVDRTTAQVTAISDPFPLIHHGVPLRVREVTVLVNRGGFMLNPSDCAAKQVGATLVSDQGASSGLANAFQASGCASLAFKPKLALRLTGRKQVKTGKHPGIRAVVTQQGVPEAGIEQAVVRLPKSLALDVNNADALCEFVDGTKPDLENHCPKGSIVGRARAVSPLLNDPLVGNVYFVKNIRKDPKTGNEIRTLPMIIAALRGEIAVNLKGESDTTRAGKLVNTFASVPDAPVSRFNLNIKGGSKGILAVTRTRRALINLCAKPKSHVAEADMDGHNGRRHDRNIRMKTPCSKKQTKAAKRQAKRAAAARRAAHRR